MKNIFLKIVKHLSSKKNKLKFNFQNVILMGLILFIFLFNCKSFADESCWDLQNVLGNKNIDLSMHSCKSVTFNEWNRILELGLKIEEFPGKPDKLFTFEYFLDLEKKLKTESGVDLVQFVYPEGNEKKFRAPFIDSFLKFVLQRYVSYYFLIHTEVIFAEVEGREAYKLQPNSELLGYFTQVLVESKKIIQYLQKKYPNYFYCNLVIAALEKQTYFLKLPQNRFQNEQLTKEEFFKSNRAIRATSFYLYYLDNKDADFIIEGDPGLQALIQLIKNEGLFKNRSDIYCGERHPVLFESMDEQLQMIKNIKNDSDESLKIESDLKYQTLNNDDHDCISTGILDVLDAGYDHLLDGSHFILRGGGKCRFISMAWFSTGSKIQNLIGKFDDADRVMKYIKCDDVSVITTPQQKHRIQFDIKKCKQTQVQLKK